MIDVNLGAGKSIGLDFGRMLFGSVHNRFGGNIRMLISGGAALPSPQDLFVGIGLPLAEGYGLTEALGAYGSVPAGRQGWPRGQAHSWCRGSNRRPRRQRCGACRSPWAQRDEGVLRQRDRHQGHVLEDGWLKTGDLGKLDRKGRLVLSGRAKDVVVTAAGENIYLDDVENTLAVRFVKEYSLVGVADDRGGERLAMLAVPDDSESDARASMHDKARESVDDAVARLPSFQRRR